MVDEGYMEKKLEEYRARKRKEHVMSNAKHILSNVLAYDNQPFLPLSPIQVTDKVTDRETEIPDTSAPLVQDSTQIAELQTTSRSDYIIYFVSAVFWLTVYGIAIHLEFGAVYFVISLLFFIWKNTRTGPKTKGEISAYSVFNENCESIDGTLKAEQFEQEIRYGAGSV